MKQVTLDGKPFAHQTADVNGVQLHYVQGGSGTPIVLLHGYPESWYAWRKAMPALSFVLLESGIPGFGLERLMDVTHGGSWHFGFFMARNFPEMLTAGREREFLTAFAYQGSTYIKDAIGEADIDEYLRHYASPGGMTAGFEYYRAFPQDAQDNQELGKKKLTMPVLALDAEHGYGGNIVTMETVATNVQGAVVPNSGHWAAEEQPQCLVNQILKFLS
jgi:pimeloyl-ACP methyl ester carboxylesterase